MCQTCGKAGEGKSVRIELRYITMLESHPALWLGKRQLGYMPCFVRGVSKGLSVEAITLVAGGGSFTLV